MNEDETDLGEGAISYQIPEGPLDLGIRSERPLSWLDIA